MSERAKAGKTQRKKRTGSERRQRDQIIPVRCKAAEAAMIRANAAAAGFGASGFLRILGTGEQRPRERRQPLPAEKLLAQLRTEAGHVDGNLAQFLRKANRGELVQPDELDDTIRTVNECWKKITALLFGGS